MTATADASPEAPHPPSGLDRPDKPLGVFKAIGIGHRTTWHEPLFYLLVTFVTQALVVLCVIPLLQLIYRLVLVETGLGALAFDKFVQVLKNPLADLTLLVLALVAVVVILAGLSTLFILAAHHQAEGSTSIRVVFGQLAATGRKLLHPQGLLIVVYLLLVLPLGHLGLSFGLTDRVAVPPFVAEELEKSPSGNLLYGAFLVVVFYLNLRLIFTVPLLATTTAGVWGSFVTSWRITRWRSLRVLLMLLVITVPAAIASAVLGVLLVVPTAITDESAPALSPVTAAVGLAIWQVMTFIFSALVLVMFAQTAVALMRDWERRLPENRHVGTEIVAARPSTVSRRRRRTLWGIAAAVTAFALVFFSITNVGVMARLAESKFTAVLAHRGFVAGGVENTLPALQAAAAAKADRVEFDVLETKDNKFVVIHDTNLKRLAGLDLNVKDLTQAELTGITVRAGGLEAKIPSLEEWIALSIKLNLPQLLEIKVHGGESPDMVPRLLALLDSKGVTNAYIYHSLSREIVQQVEALRPELVVGFIVPISFGGVPKVKCDFLVIEQQSFSDDFLDEAFEAGYNVMVWTVQEPDAMRRYMNAGVNGIISDRPDLGLETRDELAAEKGLADRLYDTIVKDG